MNQRATFQMPLDFSDVKDFAAIPEGVYAMVIDEAKYEPAREGKEHAQLRVQYKITDGELEGRTISDWMSFSPKAKFRMRDFFRGLGLLEEDSSGLPGLVFDEETLQLIEPDLVDTPVTVVIENELWNNKERNRFASVEAIEAPAAARPGRGEPAPAAAAPARQGPRRAAAEPRRIVR